MRGKLVIAVIAAALLLSLAGPMTASASGGYSLNCQWHYVDWGETLYSISRYYGVPIYAIMKANHLYDPDYIQGATYLCIPTYGYGHGYYKKGYDYGYGKSYYRGYDYGYHGKGYGYSKSYYKDYGYGYGYYGKGYYKKPYGYKGYAGYGYGGY